MVERFNGRISEIVNQTRFGSAVELKSTLLNYLKIHNSNIPQRALKHQTPIQTLKKWQQEKPELFVKRVYNQAGLDRVAMMADGGRIVAVGAALDMVGDIDMMAFHSIMSSVLHRANLTTWTYFAIGCRWRRMV